MNKKLNIVFAGTPEISETILKNLLQSEHNICGVFTQPDRPSGRGKKLTASPVKRLAQEHSVEVFQPQSFKKNPEFVEILQDLNPDIMIVVAYGLILPKSILSIPKYGCMNIHVSLLPQYRGAAPIQRALLSGDSETGVTIMQMDEGLDTGDILHQAKCLISPSDTSGTLHDKLAQLSIPALNCVLDQITNNSLTPIKQNDSDATYASKLSKDEAKIDWMDSAQVIERKIRGYQPWPMSYLLIDGQTVKVLEGKIHTEHKLEPGIVKSISKEGLEITTSTQTIQLTKLQFPGKKPMPIRDILNGRNLDHLIGQKI